MGSPASRIAVTGLLFLVTLLSSVGLGRTLRLNAPDALGEQLTGADSGVHKLFALAMGITAGVTIRNLHRSIEHSSQHRDAPKKSRNSTGDIHFG